MQKPKHKKDASITFRMIGKEKIMMEDYANGKKIPTGIWIRKTILEIIEAEEAAKC